MRSRISAYSHGPVAAVLCAGYAALVLALGVISVVILLTVQDPILLSGVALIFLTFPLGTLIWWLQDRFAQDMNPVLLVILMCLAGLLQAWLAWRLLRGRPAT